MVDAQQKVTVEQLEQLVLFAAKVVTLLGPSYGERLAWLERELEAARRDDPVARARQLLARRATAA